MFDMNESTYIIAEIGSNFDGDFERAKKLISLAKECGADAAKFQSFQAGLLINRHCKIEGEWGEHPAWNILENLSLPKEWHLKLHAFAKTIGIDFLSTPFDLQRLDLLLKLNIPFIKIASGDLTYHELLRCAAQSGKPILLSTGHATLEEVDQAVHCIKSNGGKEIVLLHCVSLYPSQIADGNLRAITTLKDTFNLPVGFSDHSPGFLLSLGAVALGACVIEKHFTDDPSREGPDHSFALNPEAFSTLVSEIRLMEKGLGTGEKKPLEKEYDERIFARRALYATTAIPKGVPLTREMIRVVRPAYPEGIPANQLEESLGKVTLHAIKADTLIIPEMLEGSYE